MEGNTDILHTGDNSSLCCDGTVIIALRLKAAYFIIVICKDDLISLERESVGTRGRGLEAVGSVFKFPLRR